MSDVLKEIAAERQRQIEVEGFTTEHDDSHDCREMAVAASCYATHYAERQWLVGGFPGGAWQYQEDEPEMEWPWDEEWWKPKAPRRDLIRAAALIVAEIERLDRKASNARHHRGQNQSEAEVLASGGWPGYA